MAADPDLARGFTAALDELEQRGITRKDVAAALGVEPNTISRYANGVREVPVSSLPKIDALCGRRRGYVLRLAGYVDDDEIDVLEAVARDDSLTPEMRRSIALNYEGLRRLVSPPPEPGSGLTGRDGNAAGVALEGR
jgi:transcriptional regulator with XRE-family HTH domain